MNSVISLPEKDKVDQRLKPRYAFKRPVFKDQESPLTQHLKSDTGFFFVGSYITLTSFIISYQLFLYFTDGVSFVQDYETITSAFQGFQYGLLVWGFFIFVQYIVVYPVTISSESKYLILTTCFFVGVSYKVFGLFVAATAATRIGPAVKLVAVLEGIRLGMKMISFMKELCDHIECNETNNNYDPETAKFRNGSGYPVLRTKPLVRPSLSHFTYFLFCPTAIYSPSYPMKKERNWSRICLYSLLLLSIIFYSLKLVNIAFIPLHVVGKQVIHWTFLMKHLYICTVFVGFIVLFVIVAFAWLQLWQNICAELLLFADRRFYGKWYREHNPAIFFLKWNFVIQNWFFRYLYLPVRRVSGKGTATILTMITSGFYHDLVFFCVTGFTVPLNLIALPLSVIVASTVLTKIAHLRILNYSLLHLGVLCGHGSLYVFYIMEYYARINCPRRDNRILDVILPRFPSCLQIDY
jgi:hypothetical protein